MAGQGTDTKTFHMNYAPETKFKTEGATKKNLSGTLADLPDIVPKYQDVPIPAHNTLGERTDTKKGASRHQIALKYSSITDFRFISHIFGGRLDQPYIIAKTGGSGTFSADEELTGGTSGAKGIVNSYSNDEITMKVFSKDEQIVGASSGATANIHSIKGNMVKHESLAGTFQAGEEIDGGTSGAKLLIASLAGTLSLRAISGDFTVGETITASGGKTGVIVSVSGNVVVYTYSGTVFANGDTITGGTSSATAIIDIVQFNRFTMSEFQDAELVTGGTSSATGTISEIYYQHYLFPTPMVDPKSWFFHNHQLPFQDNFYGCACDKTEVKAQAGNSVLTGSADYLSAQYEPDNTPDAEVAVSSKDTFHYTSISLTVNSITYTDKIKGCTITNGRSHAPLDRFGGVDPQGFGSSDFVTEVGLDIDFLNQSFITLMQNATSFPIVVTHRNIQYKDEMIYNVPSATLLDHPRKDDDNVLIQTVKPKINGVPSVTIYDNLPTHD